MQLLGLRDAAKVAERRVARLLRRAAASDIVSRRFVEVRRDFVVQVAVAIVRHLWAVYRLMCGQSTGVDYERRGEFVPRALKNIATAAIDGASRG
jgi:hypothetical protein